MTAIDVKDLKVERSGKAVLHGIRFSVQVGEVFALLGGNGAGKSTTLLTLLGFLPVAAGSVSLNGISPSANVKKIRDQVAYLPEAATLYPHLNAYENLGYFLSLSKLKLSKAELDATLEKVDLQTDARSQKMETYSKGMRQKVSIALALLRDTPILLLDEPTSGLDPVAIDEFNRLVRSLAAEGRTILMVTHDVYGACQVADRIGLLRGGELVGLFGSNEGQKIDTQTVHKAFTERTGAKRAVS
ncbi:MAG: ABC transporter ATP-binding protein [Hellea sp.]|nr:ABC transporter ATP-binding protein [Hellea sp.]